MIFTQESFYCNMLQLYRLGKCFRFTKHYLTREKQTFRPNFCLFSICETATFCLSGTKIKVLVGC